MGLPLAAAIAITAGPTIVNGIIGAVNGRKDERRAKKQRKQLEASLRNLEANRQAIIDPYRNITDLSGNLSNAYANLGVATQAAEIQMEQTDIALANTLDTIRATGGAAGGATALAQAALASKKEISAGIEQQEAANDRTRAQGEEQLQLRRMQEQQRVQQARAAGEEFMFRVREEREMTALDRAQAMLDEQRAREMQARIDKRGAISSMFGGLSQSAGSLTAAGIRAGAFGGYSDGGGVGAGGGNEYQITTKGEDVTPLYLNQIA